MWIEMRRGQREKGREKGNDQEKGRRVRRGDGDWGIVRATGIAREEEGQSERITKEVRREGEEKVGG